MPRIRFDAAAVTVGTPDGDRVVLAPTTLELTTLGIKQPGDTVNLEVDVLAKYVERLITTKETS